MRRSLAVAGAAILLAGCAGAVPTASVGDCLDVAVDAPRVTSLVAFDCALEHDIEVFAVGFSTVEDYHVDHVAEEAQLLCRREFESYVGITYQESVLDIYMLYPDSLAWTNGDREIICAAFTPDPQTGEVLRTVGSVKGSLT